MPWKIQSIDNCSPSLDSYGKPLPPPPSGYFWTRLAEGSWKLEEKEKIPCVNSLPESSTASVFEHIIMPEDTLQVFEVYEISNICTYSLVAGNMHEVSR